MPPAGSATSQIPETCRRCVAGGGAHAASRLDSLDPLEHRTVFGELLGAFRQIVAPSANTASHFRRVWPDLPLKVAPHPERAPRSRGRRVRGSEIVLLGGIGPHKGSAKLLEIARLARLSHPDLRFRVIGHTDIDAELRATRTVRITGRYDPAELPDLIAGAKGHIALFLHGWPETYSYTLSEAMAYGLLPLVPDIGAPADRVRQAGIGAVFGFPIDAGEVLRVIEATLAREESVPEAPLAWPDTVPLHRALMGIEQPEKLHANRPAGRSPSRKTARAA